LNQLRVKMEKWKKIMRKESEDEDTDVEDLQRRAKKKSKLKQIA